MFLSRGLRSAVDCISASIALHLLASGRGEGDKRGFYVLDNLKYQERSYDEGTDKIAQVLTRALTVHLILAAD